MKLRVAHIITQLELGGAQRNTLYTVSHLDTERFEPILFCGEGGILDKETKQQNYPTYFVQTLVRPLKPFRDLQTYLDLYRRLRIFRPHIVHTHSSKAGILGRLAAYFAGVPVIIHTFHGFGFNNRQKPWVRSLFVRLERLCALLSTHLVFVSEENRAEAKAKKIGRGVPTSLIRSGIDLDSTIHRPKTPQERRSRDKVRMTLDKIPKDAWKVVYVGNFKLQKNPMDLGKVALETLRQNPDIHFLFVGDGELKVPVEDWCRDQKIISQVHFLGWCQRSDDIRTILHASNCFLMTSLWEGLPRALVEAQVAGLPVVVYNVDGIRDIVKEPENGFAVEPGEVARAAEKVLWLAAHPERAKDMGARGKELVTQDFDINRMVRQQEELYAKLYEAVPLKEHYEPLWRPQPHDAHH